MNEETPTTEQPLAVAPEPVSEATLPIEPQEPAPIGRPSIYTQELADKICSELAMGKSIRTVMSEEGMPSVATIFNWFRTKPEFLEQYTRAKEESADWMADEILDIADNGANDWMERNYGEHETWVTNGEALQRSKLRVDTRKFLMAKMKPKRYGEKIDVTSGGEPIKGNTLVFTDFKPNAADSQQGL